MFTAISREVYSESTVLQEQTPATANLFLNKPRNKYRLP
jgi:hypothetical protein